MWSYFNIAGRDPVVLMVGILIIILLIAISVITINNGCRDSKIIKAFYLAFFIQLVILIIDNYIKDFPLINVDARAFEGLGWFSYENSVNVGRGEYNYLIINPIYKLLKVRVAVIFGAINIYCHILINLNMLKILKKLKIDKNLQRWTMCVLILSPISLVMRAGLLREAIIIMFVSYSLRFFIEFIIEKNTIKMLKSFVFIGMGAIFHSGVIFLAIGYFIYLLSGQKNQKFVQFFVILIAVLGFLVFKDQLLKTVGGGDIERVLAYNNDNTLKSAGSAYLTGISTTSLGQIVLYLPLFMFYFLYSPTPDMIRGVLDIVTLALNSSIYIYITCIGLISYSKARKKLTLKEKKILKAMLVSVIITVAVFSIGTRNAGTAMRHRDKILPFSMLAFVIVRNRYCKEIRSKEIKGENR